MDITAKISVGPHIYEIHSSVINGWILSIVIVIVLLVAKRQMEQMAPDEKPKGLALWLEVLVAGVDKFVVGTMGPHNSAFAPFIGMLVLYISGANLFGLLGLESPTTDVNVTLALSLFTIWMMVYTGIKKSGVLRTLKNLFFGEFPWLFPLEVITQLARPISLAFRLFGAILSGNLLLHLLYGALGWFSPLLLPFFHIYFDLFEGLVQVLIFVMLAMIWTSMLTEEIEPEQKT